MPKQSAQLPLALPPRPAKSPAAQWLYAALRDEILAGRLKAGARLPATRDFALAQRLSRGTVVFAFEQLKSEGYLTATVGSGTYVARLLPDRLLQTGVPAPGAPALGAQAPRLGTEAPPRRGPRRRLSRFGRRAQAFPGLRVGRVRAFRANQPAIDLFPTDLWARVASRRLRLAPAGLFVGCGAAGYEPLRRAVADYLSTSRGVRCGAEQVLIVSGVQEALDLAARLFLDPGDRVAMENPGYIGARLVFEAHGAIVVSTPLDEEGLRLDRGRLDGVRLAYATPAHQFPLGVGMSIARRLALIEWARLSGAMIFEDDYDSEYRYSGRPVPALQGLDPHGVVLFAGSFSKVLFPSLRLGYLVVPADLVERFEAAISITMRHAPVLEQAVLTDFIADGHFARHIRRMRQIYAERLSVLLASAREHLGDRLEISSVEAGLQTVGWLPEGMDAAAFAEAAARREVEVTPLATYARGGAAARGLHLGFAAVDPREIRRGVQVLGEVLQEMGRRATPRSR